MAKLGIGMAACVAVASGALAGFAPTHASAQDVFIGEVRTFGFNWCPRGWAQTSGQLLPISQNTALFSLLGTTYGGDGRTTFALPDLRGRTQVSPGTGPGLGNYVIGQKGGAERTTLSIQEMPSHAHNVLTPEATANGSAAPARGPNAVNVVQALQNAGGSTQPTGNGQPHNNMPPYLAITTCIALQGIFPSRS